MGRLKKVAADWFFPRANWETLNWAAKRVRNGQRATTEVNDGESFPGQKRVSVDKTRGELLQPMIQCCPRVVTSKVNGSKENEFKLSSN